MNLSVAIPACHNGVEFNVLSTLLSRHDPVYVQGAVFVGAAELASSFCLFFVNLVDESFFSAHVVN